MDVIGLWCVSTNLCLIAREREPPTDSSFYSVDTTASIRLWSRTLQYLRGFNITETVVRTLASIVRSIKVRVCVLVCSTSCAN